MHHDKQINENNERKPVIIHFYNKNKVGVDAFDQSCANKTCRRKTNRWPFNVFCFIIDAAVQNSFSLINLLEKNRSEGTRFRKECIETLAIDMCNKAAKHRVDQMKEAKFNGYRRTHINSKISKIISP